MSAMIHELQLVRTIMTCSLPVTFLSLISLSPFSWFLMVSVWWNCSVSLRASSTVLPSQEKNPHWRCMWKRIAVPTLYCNSKLALRTYCRQKHWAIFVDALFKFYHYRRTARTLLEFRHPAYFCAFFFFRFLFGIFFATKLTIYS